MSQRETRALGVRAQAMIDELAAITAEPGKVMRLYLTPEHKRAADLVDGWMGNAGLTVRMDSAGTVHGLLAAARSGDLAAKRLLVGSHIDTVIDAGRYDGTFGVVAGILAAEQIRARGIALPFALEILAFGDEEGVRYPTTLMSSSALAGSLNAGVLEMTDAAGVTLRSALAAFGVDPERLTAEAYRRDDLIGYLEVHIEQGPVLEQAGQPLGVVTAIASQGRYRAHVRGEAGHAGTVPMAARNDALAGAAEIIAAVEDVARAGSRSSLVGTVGEIVVAPGASNVIPGRAEFSIDVRATDDDTRLAAIAEIRQQAREIGQRRALAVAIETVHEKPVVLCSPRLMTAIAAAVRSVTGDAPPELMSGAGHDGQAMIHVTDIGMIFVRCRAGVSHNPLEFVSIDDMGLSVEALVETIVELAAEKAE